MSLALCAKEELLRDLEKELADMNSEDFSSRCELLDELMRGLEIDMQREDDPEVIFEMQQEFERLLDEHPEVGPQLLRDEIEALRSLQGAAT